MSKLSGNYRKIGEEILQEWLDAYSGHRRVNRSALRAKIRNWLDFTHVPGDPTKPKDIDVIIDSDPRENNESTGIDRFVFIAIPMPDVDGGSADLTAWLQLNNYIDGNGAPIPAKMDQLGQAVIFGCGR
jgi:hypothetical protein